MTIDQITALIISLCPSLIAILTAIGTIIRVMHDFKALKKEVLNMKSVEDVNGKLSNLLQENYELKKKLNELLTKIDRIERK